jgi:hypothetical protein
MIDKNYVKQLWEMSKQAGKNDPKGGYNGSTFLYIRALPNDDGITVATVQSNGTSVGTVKRPWPRHPGLISPTISPDIEIFDLDGNPINASTLKVNKSYIIRVTVRNGGDSTCNSCTVELFLGGTSVKPNFSNSRLLGSQVVDVLGHSFTNVEFHIDIDNTMIQYKELIARVFSLITNDYPADWVTCGSNEDRHIGEQYIIIK